MHILPGTVAGFEQNMTLLCGYSGGLHTATNLKLNTPQ